MPDRGDRPAGRAAAPSSTRRSRRPSRSRSSPRCASTTSRRSGRPEVEITEFTDGEPLKFTAEVDVRPEITLPDLATIEVTVDELEIGDERDRRAGQRPAGAVRHAQDRRAGRPPSGDYVQIDLDATVDGEEVPGGSATNISHEVGSKQLLPGLDEVLVGHGRRRRRPPSPPSWSAATSPAGTPTSRSPCARSRRRSCPSSTTSSPSWPASSTRWTSCATTCASGSAGSSRSSRSTRPGTRRSKRWSRRPRCRRRRVSSREEVEGRKQAMVDQLERIGASLEDYLAAEEQDRGADRRRADRGGRPRASRSSSCSTRSPTPRRSQVTDDEFGHEIVHRAQRAGMAPQQYYDQLVRSGAGRRGLRRRAAGQGAGRGDGAGHDQGHRRQRASPWTTLRGRGEHEHDHDHEH